MRRPSWADEGPPEIPPLPAVSAGDLGVVLALLHRRSRQDMLEQVKPFGVELHCYLILAMLDALGSPSQIELSTALGQDAGDLVSRLDDLEAQDLVERSVNAADRRRNVVRLTPEGRRLLGGLYEAGRERTRKLLAPLTDDEQAVLVGLVARLLGR
jgi:MarR family transcriptional regulator, lower aerobic nicotinate degradation pathway regulator